MRNSSLLFMSDYFRIAALDILTKILKKIRLSERDVILIGEEATDLVTVATGGATDLEDLGIDEGAIPPALDEREEEAFLAIEEAASEDVAVEEIGEAAPEEGEAIVAALDRELLVVVGIERHGCLAYGIVDVLVAIVGEVDERMVAEVVFELHGAPFGERDVLVHDSSVITPTAGAEEAQQADGIDSVAHPSTHEDMSTLEDDSVDVGWQLWQAGAYLVDELGQQVLVGIESQDPVGSDRQVVEGPVELRCLMSRPGMLHHFDPELTADVEGAVGTLAVDDDDAARQGADVVETAADVLLLVVGEDEDGEG